MKKIYEDAPYESMQHIIEFVATSEALSYNLSGKNDDLDFPTHNEIKNDYYKKNV